jgi:hypothetical protein
LSWLQPSFAGQYHCTSSSLSTNRLYNLQDSSHSTAYKIDLPTTIAATPADTAIAHYTYDATGNITKDLVSGLTSITWNRMGKVKGITRLGGSKLNFAYDALGNRIAKELVLYPGTDTMVKLKAVYVRDASGNTLAVYENEAEYDITAITPAKLTYDPTLSISTPLPIDFTTTLAGGLLGA